MSATTEQQTLPQKAADAIIRLIQTENYAAGTKLPNEYELSRMLQVSRNTVREAIKLLVSRNILEVRRGAGTFVSNKHGLGDDPLGLSMITDQPRMIHEIMQICYLINPEALLSLHSMHPARILNICKLFWLNRRYSATKKYSAMAVILHFIFILPYAAKTQSFIISAMHSTIRFSRINSSNRLPCRWRSLILCSSMTTIKFFKPFKPMMPVVLMMPCLRTCSIRWIICKNSLNIQTYFLQRKNRIN